MIKDVSSFENIYVCISSLQIRSKLEIEKFYSGPPLGFQADEKNLKNDPLVPSLKIFLQL
jgi:hypothetical protein